jgi:hypothetical protein
MPTHVLTPGDPAGEEEMPAQAGAVDATIDKVLDQAFSRAHEDWLGTQQLSAAGNGALAEVNRWSMQAAASNQVYLASGILSQRSAQAQPQQLPGPGGTGIPAGFKLVPE